MRLCRLSLWRNWIIAMLVEFGAVLRRDWLSGRELHMHRWLLLHICHA